MMLTRPVFIPAVILMAIFATGLHAAQFENPIQAAKDAYNKAKQQQQQQQQQQPNQNKRQQPAQSQQPQAPAQAQQPAAPAASAGAAPGGDCCSADAMKKVASSLSYLDIVGVK